MAQNPNLRFFSIIYCCKSKILIKKQFRRQKPQLIVHFFLYLFSNEQDKEISRSALYKYPIHQLHPKPEIQDISWPTPWPFCNRSLARATSHLSHISCTAYIIPHLNLNNSICRSPLYPMPLAEARRFADSGNVSQAEAAYKTIINNSTKPEGPEAATTETAMLELGKIYQKQNQAQSLKDLITESRTVLGSFSKSKTAKIVKTLIEYFDTIPESLDIQMQTAKDSIDWAIGSKLTFLKQSLQLKLAELLYKKTLYQQALTIITELLREYKKLDDKSSLIEVQLLELKLYHQLRNIPKAKAALTLARTSANSIYCPTLLQGELDSQSGILNAEDKDYKTAYSYFYEAFEAFNSQDDSRAVPVLKYMLLSKIMLNLSDDVATLLKNKNVVKFQSRDIDAMKAIAQAYANRSLHEFEQALTTYGSELKLDAIIKYHFNSLYDNLLEQNLLKIIELYSCVELSHISRTLGLELAQVEGKLSQMILDKVFYGVLDQGNGWLIIYDEVRQDAAYDSALDLVKNMSNVVDLLYQKAAALN